MSRSSTPRRTALWAGLLFAWATGGLAQNEAPPADSAPPTASASGAGRIGEAALLGVTAEKDIRAALAPADGGVVDGGEAGDAGSAGRASGATSDGGPSFAEEREANAGLAALIAEQEADRQQADEARERAEKARALALERAKQAHNETLGRLHTQLAACETARVEIARVRTGVGEAVRASLEAATEAMKQTSERRRAAKQPTTDADALFDVALKEQREALDAARTAIRQRHVAPSEDLVNVLAVLPDRAELQLSRQFADDRTAAEIAPLLSELDTALADVDRQVRELDHEGDELRYRAAEAWLDVAQVANETRLVLIERLSPAHRQALHSLTEEGRDNVTVALEHVGTLLSFHFLRRTHDVVMLPKRLSDPIFSGRVVWALFKLVLLALVVVFGVRRSRVLYPKLKASYLAGIHNGARRKLIDSVLAIVEDAAPQGLALAIFLLSLDILQAIGPEPELSTVFGLLIWIWTYQLSAKLLHRLVLRLARRRHTLTVPIKLRILRTVRAVLRFGFVAALLLQVTNAVVGAGVLYAAVRGGVLLAGALLFLVLVARWRTDIVEVYLDGWGDSRLAQTIGAYRERWFSLPLAVAALAAVAARAVVILARDFALGFEQTRKALAYLFQIRVERQAKERGQRAFDLDAVPADCREALADRPCDTPAWTVDRFAEQAPVVQRITEGHPLSILVSSPGGGGLTTWLMRLSKSLEGVHLLNVTPQERWRSAERVISDVANALDVDTPEPTVSDIVAAVRRIDAPVVFVVDELERAFTRRIGGYAPLSSLISLMSETEFTCSWIVGGRSNAVTFLERVRGLSASFDRQIALPPWSEEAVRELVQKRMRACKVELSFEDLLLQEVDATSEEARERQTEHAYLRMLWNVAEGNPRTVLHLWQRSLSPDGKGGLRVHLHDAPSPDVLEALPVQERFLLHALVLMRALSPAEMAVTCNQPVSRARAHVARGLEIGLYAIDSDGLVTIQPHFFQTVLRFLRRKNLLN
jgi:hypothetical protein